MAAPDGDRYAFVAAQLVRGGIYHDDLPLPFAEVGIHLDVAAEYHDHGHLRLHRVHRQAVRYAGSGAVIVNARLID